MRLGFVQYGDYKEAFNRLKSGGDEDYYAQRYSVQALEALSEKTSFTGVCSLQAKEPYETALSGKLHAAGIPLLPNFRIDASRVCALLKRWKITHLVLRTPSPYLLKWCLSRGVAVLPIFADSWERIDGIRNRLDTYWLKRLLWDERVAVIGNHNIPASLSLQKLGVPAEKIIPWDWPHALTPDSLPVKTLSGGTVRIVFVGAITESKGAIDCIEAANLLADKGLAFDMRLIGSGEGFDRAHNRIAELGLEDRVSLTGKLFHPEVVDELKQAHLSLVLSRHEYAEGLPMTVYEALATRTPLVVSDHPMFRLFLNHTPAARMVPQKDPNAAANAITELLADHAAYRSASEATAELWRRIKGDLNWGTLLETWLAEPASARDKLAAHALPERLAALEIESGGRSAAAS